MQTSQINQVPKWFWIVASVMLLWNLLGVMAFVQQVTMSPEQINSMPVAEQRLYLEQPFWVLLAFAFAVFGGTLGCLALLLKKSFARVIFYLSFIGVLVQMTHSFFISNALDVYGPGAAVMPIMILIFSIFLIWLSGKAIDKGWIA
ncbi:hypothetical protein Q4574_02185 [Aliiglaciecola sp. 3_MG-2023]|uniref:hypothetical protein n=1 Tax=Aliiglaciecola sp. 3_MG-2023 TaxID=3062644 RepID=UPI0026E37A60|nr:hypothetical protein [Aliiglaciecola sp. 3_MG-2023]MDO6692070.1 hypothetical protein [Aliiglaciecola sp. 3_MG-2023]